ncbi:MAG: tetratricopeptide repeat protein [Candidatus Hodarchaeales archaeon]
MSLQNRIDEVHSSRKDKNPNDRLQKASVTVLKELLADETSNSNDIYLLATLCCYLTVKMKGYEIVDLLKQVNHEYIRIFIIYYEEKPGNLTEITEKLEYHAENLEQEGYFTLEMKAHLINIESWIYGQQGNISRLKEYYRHCKERLLLSANPIEQLGLQETVLNCIWWFLHSGIEANVISMLAFIKPFVDKYGFYRTRTDFLNTEGTVHAHYGDADRAIAYYNEYIQINEKYNNDYKLSIGLGNAAETLVQLGQFKKAKNMMERAVKLYEQSTGQLPALHLVELANMYYFLDDPRAEQCFLQAYEIQKGEESIDIANILFELVHFYLRSEIQVEAELYLSEFRFLAKSLQIPSVNAQLDYLLGFKERQNHNFSNAHAILTTALEKAMLIKDIELIFFCNIQLLAVNLQLYRLDEKQIKLNIALNYLETILQLARENQHQQILVIALLISTVLNAMNNDFEQAEKDITEVKESIKELDFKKWHKDVETVTKSLNRAKITGIFEFEKENAVDYILPRFKSMLSLKPAERAQKEAETLGLLVISKSGTPVFSKFVDKLKVDDILLSGLIMAITTIASGIIERKDVKGLERLQDVVYEDFSLSFKEIENGLIAVITSTTTSASRIWVSAVANRIGSLPYPVRSGLASEIRKNISELLEQKGL